MFKKPELTFFIPYLFFLVAGGLMMMLYTQKEMFFWVNEHDVSLLDRVAEPTTDLGDGITCIVLGIFLLIFIKIRQGLALLIACALEGIIVQVLKIYVFIDKPRPWAFYKATYHLHLVHNFVPYTNNSFPSGHTATAFCMAAILSLTMPRAKMGWFFFLIAGFIAYSRIYLSQHYFIDIYAGSIIGVLAALFVYFAFYGIAKKNDKELQRLNRPLIKLKK